MREIANRYLMQSIVIIAVLALLTALYIIGVGQTMLFASALVPAAAFQLVACVAYGMTWRMIAGGSVSSLPLFYLAASGLRMLAGVAFVLVYLFVVKDTLTVRFFVITFLIYYLLLLIYDTIYFVKVEKKIHQNG